ncbi:MFS transporter [Pseudomonas sp. ABY48]|uniref:MFS transporter n=1 Tax=Pseudomonas sp. ABY48 TaxID=3402865 RepID=UPI003B43B915
MIFNRRTFPLYAASLVSKIGDFAYEVLFAILAIELLSFDLYYLGLVYFFRFMPYLLFGPVGGWLADAFAHKRIMLLGDILRLLTTASFYVVFVEGHLNIYFLVASSMVMTVGRALFQPSFRAYLPSALDAEDLPAGNSLLQVIEDVASVLGPLVCSLIIAWGDKGDVIFMYTVTYLLSVCFLFFLGGSRSCVRTRFLPMNIFSEAKEIATNMFCKNPKLFMVIAGTSVCVLFTASLLRFVLPASIIDIYEDEKLVGFVFSIMSLGTVLGGICYTRLVGNSTPIQLMRSWMVYGLLFFAVSIVVHFNLLWVFFVIFFLGFSGAMVDISIITNIQSLSEEGGLGKNYGIYSTIANTCEATSGLVSGVFSLLVGGGAFSCLSLMIAMAAKTAIYKLKREKNDAEEANIKS